MASPSVHSGSFLFGKHLANRLALRPSQTQNSHASGGLRRRHRFHHRRLPVLLLHTPLLHPRTHRIPVSHPLLLPPPPLFPLLRFRPPPLTPPLFYMNTAAPPPSSGDPIPTKTDRVVIKGRVQGVFYRDWTVQNATELGLTGWVRNRRDGSVEALFSGPSDKVQEMEQRCRSGPPAAAVTGFQVFPCSDDPGSGFEGRPTV